MSCKEYTPAIKVLNQNVPHKSLSPTMILWNKQRHLSRRIVTTPLHKKRPRHVLASLSRVTPSCLRISSMDTLPGCGFVTSLSLRNTSSDTPTGVDFLACATHHRIRPHVVEPIACLSAITSPHLISHIFYPESSIPNLTLQGERILLQLLLTLTLQTSHLVGVMARLNNQSA